MAMTRGLVDVLNALHKEEAALRTQLDRVRDAITALGGGRQALASAAERRRLLLGRPER